MRTTRVAFDATDSAYDAGMSIPSTRHAWFALCWCLAATGTAWAQVDVVTISKQEPICLEADDPFIEVPVNVCNILVHLEEPSIQLLSVGNADITTDDPSEFFQHPFNFTPFAPLCAAIPSFPGLVCDSFVTIGHKCGPPGPDTDQTSTDGDFDAGEFNFNGHVVGGWFNSDPFNGQGLPDENGDVLVAQLAVTEGFDISGTFTAFVQGDFGGEPGACPDFNDDGFVGPFDIAVLLGNWGDCPKPCPADLDGDGTVGPADLGLLLGAWGPCTPGAPPPSVEAFDLEFSCFGPACKVDEDCDDGDPCTADTCAEGACDNSPADCNDNGIPDCDDIANETSADCNGNSIPDECEEDCNANGLADECDIADCPPETPACDDCNLNGVPDECDIDSGLSEDVDMNGVPDECCEAQVSGDWSEDIWCVEEGYPDNDPKNPVGVPDLSVTLAGEGLTVFADVTVEIPSLRLINAASLDVTNDGEQGDLTIFDPNGVLDGNLLIKGTLTVGGDHVINAAGEVTIGAGGTYKSAIGLKDPASGDLQADDIIVECGGTLRLEGPMNMGTQGDVTLRDSEDDGKGDCTPPDFEAADGSSATVGGDFTIQGPANIDYNSTQPLLLGGDFDNQSTDAEIFDWSGGGILLNGPLHTIEAAGENRGRWPAGFADNFAIGTLTLAADTTVQVVDTFDNQQDGFAECDEALYVDTCVLEAGATLLTNGCHVYYRELFNDGSIPGLGVDVLELLEPVPADFNGDGVVDAFDLAFLLGHWDDCPEPCTPGEPAETCVTDLNGDCVTEAFDLAVLLGSWGPP